MNGDEKSSGYGDEKSSRNGARSTVSKRIKKKAAREDSGDELASEQGSEGAVRMKKSQFKTTRDWVPGEKGNFSSITAAKKKKGQPLPSSAKVYTVNEGALRALLPVFLPEFARTEASPRGLTYSTATFYKKKCEEMCEALGLDHHETVQFANVLLKFNLKELERLKAGSLQEGELAPLNLVLLRKVISDLEKEGLLDADGKMIDFHPMDDILERFKQKVEVMGEVAVQNTQKTTVMKSYLALAGATKNEMMWIGVVQEGSDELGELPVGAVVRAMYAVQKMYDQGDVDGAEAFITEHRRDE
jgi:hypothetical protein